MTVRRIARFRPHSAGAARKTGLRRRFLGVALRVMDVLAISVAALIIAVPIVYGRKRANEAIDQWSTPRLNDMDRVEREWTTYARPPEFTQGDEPAVKDFIQAHPLVAALLNRSGRPTVWIRRGDRFVPAGDDAASRAWKGWFGQAEREETYFSYAQGVLPGEERPGPKIVLRGDHWLVGNHWREGSPDVERFLRNLCGAQPGFRVALLRDGDDVSKALAPQPWGAEPNLQADAWRAAHSIFSTAIISNEFPGWQFTVIPFRAEAKAIQWGWRRQALLAGFASLLVGASLAAALLLRARARRKAALDADRMASMTHSLKTPLAILKFRCDTLRLGRVPAEQLDSHLIQIAEEADRLSGIIENALMAIQDPAEAGPQEEVTPEWIESVAEDLAPAFDAANRRLVVACAYDLGRAALPSLRAALFTLVENALHHGRGTVTLETARARKRLLIKVSDEGEGLDSACLESLGRPFMRIRDKDMEGFRREGRGLGLSLLAKVVEREGWGLTFASEEGRGLSATLEIASA